MPRPLPEYVDPLRRAEQGATLCGHIALRRMTRLAGALCDAEGEVEAELHFDRDEQGVAFIRLQVEARLRAICQRCLEPMEIPVRRDVLLGLVRSEEEGERLPSRYEPLLITAGPVDVAGLVEDELILALPIVPLHGDGEHCPVRIPYHSGDGGTDEKTQHPFAVLERLKRDH